MKFIISLAFLLLSCLVGLGDQSASDSKYGERPASSVFDPTGVLTPKELEEISAPLVKILQDEGIEVIVVVIPEIGEAPPQHVAAGFADKWTKSRLNAIVLHVPDHPKTPWIVPGEIIGLAVEPAAIKATVADAEKRARAEPDDFGKIRAASIEAADAIRYWTGGAFIRSEQIISQRLQRQLRFEKRERLLKLAGALAAAAAIPLIFGLVFIYLRIKNNRPKHFPPLRKVSRLGAPYSGGNQAVIESRRNHN